VDYNRLVIKRIYTGKPAIIFKDSLQWPGEERFPNKQQHYKEFRKKNTMNSGGQVSNKTNFQIGN
jgi:hypothetical protein